MVIRCWLVLAGLVMTTPPIRKPLDLSSVIGEFQSLKLLLLADGIEDNMADKRDKALSLHTI